MIRQWLGEEILYRDAIGRGLDQDDELVRRRLVQKMNGIARGLAQLAEPAEAEMRAFYLDKLYRYVVPARRSFRQVYVSTELGHDVAELRAAELLDVLPQASPDAATGLGGPFVLASEFSLLTAQEVAARFGPHFAESLFDLVPGVWEGPIPSSFALHLVQVSAIAEDHVPSFSIALPKLVCGLAT